MAINDRSFAGGTKLKAWRTGETAGGRDVAGVTSIGGPSFETGVIDATEIDPYQGQALPGSPQFIKKFIAGWTDLGELPLELNMVPDEVIKFNAYQLNNQLVNFRIDFRAGYSLAIRGFVKTFGVNSQQEDLVKSSIVIKLSGDGHSGGGGSGPVQFYATITAAADTWLGGTP